MRERSYVHKPGYRGGSGSCRRSATLSLALLRGDTSQSPVPSPPQTASQGLVTGLCLRLGGGRGSQRCLLSSPSGESGFPVPSDKCSRLSHSYSSGNPAQEATEKKKKKNPVWVISLFLFCMACLHCCPPERTSTRRVFRKMLEMSSLQMPMGC